MKKFIVVREEYNRGPSGPISVDLRTAEDLDDLIRGLGVVYEGPEDGPWPIPSAYLRDANGDGMDFYVIKELRPDGRLGPDLLVEWENA